MGFQDSLNEVREKERKTERMTEVNVFKMFLNLLSKNNN